MIEYFVALCVILITWTWLNSRPPKFPPGPLRLPILNNFHNISIDETCFARMRALHDHYGPILSISVVGHNKWDVWLEGYELAKEVWHDPRFASRTIFPLGESMGTHRGLAFASGSDTKMKRKLTLQILRALGVGKSTFSTGIEEEIETLLQYMDRYIGKNFYVQGAIAYTTNNIISKLLFNTSYSFDDEDYAKMYQRIMRAFALFNPTQVHWTLPYSISRHLPRTKELKKLRKEFLAFNKQCYENRRPDENSDIPREPECVSDFLLEQFKRARENPNEQEPFCEEDVPFVLVDLFMAGQETTTTTIGWALLNMLHSPEVQERVYEELRREFPARDQIIHLNGITSLCNYTMATIHEVQRFTPVTITAIDHTANVDVGDFHGYYIPEGTRMMVQLALMNKDPQLWKHPDTFNPDNFLDALGNFVKSQYLMPFAVGLRSCPGENIAKMELYLVFANIMRRFKVCPPGEGKKVPGLTPQIGLVAATPYYEVRLEKREN